MKTVRRLLASALADEGGATAIEYGVVAAVVAVVLYVGPGAAWEALVDGAVGIMRAIVP